MPTPYALPCPIARTLDLIGERWTMLVLRELSLKGPRKFKDFEAVLPACGPATLSARLKGLEAAGLVKRRFYEEHPPRAEYLLTAKGESLRPILRALRDWGLEHLNEAGDLTA
ncbi:MAG TPA: helix-turn-helix domain-containing protein [Caulobacteraceae bacterium]|jgi:DNA-binding HxlR family transcriptional regulator|nr:helix-turn-helix domain-containing protein [Caulobacteraceae bacterium]